MSCRRRSSNNCEKQREQNVQKYTYLLPQAEAIFSTPKNSSQIPKIWRSYMMLWNMLIFRIEAMLEGKAVNASQVLNYYKHMWKLVSKERTAGNKHTLLLPVLQQKLTSQLLNNTARKAEGESGSRKAEGLAVEIDRKSIYEVEEEMQQ
nr:hypothetical protein CFP56_17107 [Quercus suber]